MRRREFLAAAAGGSFALTLTAANAKPSIIELRRFQLRNTQDEMVRHTNDFLAKGLIPAMQKAGAKAVGAFNSFVAPDGPFALIVSEWPDVGAWSSLRELDDAQYVRKEVALLRGFSTMPVVEVPTAREEGKTHIFELRIYESNSDKTLARKVKMFDEGEIAIFRKVGMLPVFFGETIAGAKMPNLTYMLAYDDLAARDKTWTAFASSPEWAKLRGTPGYSDAEIVSNISNCMLKPLPFSPIK